MAGDWALHIEQGATFDVTLTWKDSAGTPVDLTGYSARAQVRSMHTSATPIVDMTVGGGQLALGGAAGTIRILLTDTVTAALPAPFAGVWDLELESGTGVTTRLLAGAATVSPEVTR